MYIVYDLISIPYSTPLDWAVSSSLGEYSAYKHAGSLSHSVTVLVHQVPIAAGWAEAVWNEKFAPHFYTWPPLGALGSKWTLEKSQFTGKKNGDLKGRARGGTRLKQKEVCHKLGNPLTIDHQQRASVGKTRLLGHLCHLCCTDTISV